MNILRQGFVILSLLIFATGILSISILRTTTPQYVFSQATAKSRVEAAVEYRKPVEYHLAYPGILPDHFLWSIKAARDRVWLFLTTDQLKKAELLLLFADKRVGAAKVLLEGGKTELSVAASTKAEKYLEQAADQEKKAREKGAETGQFLERLALATLKHREVLEELYTNAPDEARPMIAEALNYPKRLFDRIKASLREINRPIPPSPFEE